jgi:hypothetical protein
MAKFIQGLLRRFNRGQLDYIFFFCGVELFIPTLWYIILPHEQSQRPPRNFSVYWVYSTTPKTVSSQQYVLHFNDSTGDY